MAQSPGSAPPPQKCIYKTSADFEDVAYHVAVDPSSRVGIVPDLNEKYVLAMTYIWRNAEFALALNNKYFEVIHGKHLALGSADWDPEADWDPFVISMENIKNPQSIELVTVTPSSATYLQMPILRGVHPATELGTKWGLELSSANQFSHNLDVLLADITYGYYNSDPLIGNTGAAIELLTKDTYSMITEDLLKIEKDVMSYELDNFKGALLYGCEEIFGDNPRGYIRPITKSDREVLLYALASNVEKYKELLDYFWNEAADGRRLHELYREDQFWMSEFLRDLTVGISGTGDAKLQFDIMADMWDSIVHFDFDLVESLIGENLAPRAHPESEHEISEGETIPSAEVSPDAEDKTIYETFVCPEDLEQQSEISEPEPPPAKEFCIDWTLADRTGPYYDEKAKKYFVSYDVVVQDFAAFKQNLDSYKPDALQILNDYFGLNIDFNVAEPQHIINLEDVYYEPRDFKPSKILFSLSSEDAAANTLAPPSSSELSEVPALPPRLPNLSQIASDEETPYCQSSGDKTFSLKVSELIDVLDTITLKMEKFNNEYSLWKFVSPGPQKANLQDTFDLLVEIKKFRLFKLLFYRLFERNGLSLNDSLDAIIRFTFAETPSPPVDPPDLLKIEISIPFRFTTPLIWVADGDDLGGLKSNEPFDDLTSVNYLFNLDKIIDVINVISWSKFYETFRAPRPSFEISDEEDLFKVHGLSMAQNISKEVVDGIVGDIKGGINAAKEGLNLFANKYNQNTFKTVQEKLVEDAQMNDIEEMRQRIQLSSETRFDVGDKVSGGMNGTFMKTTAPSMGDSFTTDMLNPLGLNFIKFSSLLSLALVARAIPVEKLKELNFKQQLASLEPKLIIKLVLMSLEAGQEKGIDLTKDLALASKILNIILKSKFFICSSKAQQLYLDFIHDNGDPTTDFTNIVKFEELLADIEQSDVSRMKEHLCLMSEFIEGNKIGSSDIQINSEEIQSLMGDIGVDDLPPQIMETYNMMISPATDTLEMFSAFQNCELPSPDIFSKHKDLTKNLKDFGGYSRISMPEMPATAAIPDPKATMVAMIPVVVLSLFHEAMTSILKSILSQVNQLTSDENCSKIAASIEKAAGLHQGNNFAASIVDEMSKALPANQNLTPNEAFEALNEISDKIGLTDGVNTEDLDRFINIIASVLTQRELCNLLKGKATPDTTLMVKNILEVQFSDSGISSNSEDIARYFQSMGKFIDPSCLNVISDDNIPVNTAFCSTPEDYKLYAELRCNLLKMKGLDKAECEEQLDLLSDIAECKAEELMSLIGGPNPFTNLLETDSGAGCGTKSLVPGLAEIVAGSLTPLFESIFNSIQASHMIENVGGRGLINTILSNKNGIQYPSYKSLQAHVNSFGVSVSTGGDSPPSTRLATWLRLNASYWASSGENKAQLVPLYLNSAFNSVGNHREEYEKLANFTAGSIDYETFFSNHNSGLRTLSFYGVPNHVTEFSILPEQRPRVYNFKIMPYEPYGLIHQINTKVIDYNPLVFNPSQTDLTSYPIAEDEYASISKIFTAEEYIKDLDDYLVDILEDVTTDFPTIDSITTTTYNTPFQSHRASVFTETILNSMVSNLGISPDLLDDYFMRVIRRSSFNIVYNAFLDGIIGIPVLNDKNFLYGKTNRQMNLLNSEHINSVTSKPSPVTPEDFGGTEDAPVVYFYNKLNDNWVDLYNISVLDADSQFSPQKTSAPDFVNIAKESAELSSKLKDEMRTAEDLTNQAPFDLIVSKNSMATMNGLISSFIRTITYEYYVKAFPLLNTIEYNNSVFDSVFSQFLAARLKQELIKAGVKYQGKDKTKEFMYRFLEINATLMLKKREQKIETYSQKEEDLLDQILRKANIWRYGVPSNNISPAESEYFNAYAKLSELETPNYPAGVLKAAIKSGKRGAEVAIAMAKAKEDRKRQIELRDIYWNRIISDSEDICLELLKGRFKEELVKMTDQFSVLNVNLGRLNNILYTPLTGGPTIQASVTLAENNVFKKSPAFLASVYDEDEPSNSDYNLNGFILTSFDNIINSGPKEPAAISPWAFTGGDLASSPFAALANSLNQSAESGTDFIMDNDNQKSYVSDDLNYTLQPDRLAKLKNFNAGDQNIYTQNTIPFRVEKYLRLKPYKNPNDSANPQLVRRLNEALYDNIGDNVGADNIQPGFEETIFTGPVGLNNLSYYLNSIGFFNNMSPVEKVTSLDKLFESIEFGLRLNILLPRNTDNFGQDDSLSPLLRRGSDIWGNALTPDTETQIKLAKEKSFNKMHNHSIPLFVEEMELGPKYTLATLASFEDTDEYRLPLERAYIQELMDRMVCSKEYKVFFDYCIPLRYFMSLSAIYCSKGFMHSIGSVHDWQKASTLMAKNSGFDNYDYTNIFENTRKNIRKLFSRTYMSFSPNEKGDDDEFDSKKNLTEQISSQSATSISGGKDPITPQIWQEIALGYAKDVKAFHETYNEEPNDSEMKEALDVLIDSLPPTTKKHFIKDPTNALGNAFDEAEED
jgi:hypothetical protein